MILKYSVSIDNLFLHRHDLPLFVSLPYPSLSKFPHSSRYIVRIDSDANAQDTGVHRTAAEPHMHSPPRQGVNMNKYRKVLKAISLVFTIGGITSRAGDELYSLSIYLA